MSKDAINQLEEVLICNRGWSLRQPVDESIIILVSGGVDSSILAEMCIKLLNTKLYPIYIKRGAHAEISEISSANKIIKYLDDMYPHKTEPLKIIECNIVPKELASLLDPSVVKAKGLPMRNLMLISLAMQYAMSLREEVRTIVLGAEGLRQGDAGYPDMRLSSLLANTVALCENIDDWSWQVMSPLLIPGLLAGEDYVTKEGLACWARDNNFPIRETYSCTTGNSACRVCKSCKSREKVIKLMKGRV